MCQIVYIITTSGKVANLTAIDETSDKASIVSSIWLNLVDRTQIDVMGHKISFDTLKNHMDPTIINMTKMKDLYFVYNGYRYSGPFDIVHTTPQTTEEFPVSESPPTTSLSLTNVTPDKAGGGLADPTTNDSMIVAVPSGIHTANDRGSIIVIRLWLIAISVVAVSNCYLMINNNNH